MQKYYLQNVINIYFLLQENKVYVTRNTVTNYLIKKSTGE